MLDWHGTGLSVMEMSHRGKAFVEIAETAKANLRKLMQIPDDFTIFFFQGGACQQFAAVPLNLFGDDAGAVNYLTTGTWSETAIKEAHKYSSDVTECASNKSVKYTDIAEPTEWKINSDAKYFHYCDNETI